MSDPTAAEAAAETLWRYYLNTGHVDSWSSYGATKGDALVVARDVLDALGIDPDSPVSLLHWHTDQHATHLTSTRHAPSFTTRYGCTNHQAPTHAR